MGGYGGGYGSMYGGSMYGRGGMYGSQYGQPGMCAARGSHYYILLVIYCDLLRDNELW